MTCTSPEHRWHRTDEECRTAMEREAAVKRMEAQSSPLFAVPTEGK